MDSDGQKPRYKLAPFRRCRLLRPDSFLASLQRLFVRRLGALHVGVPAVIVSLKLRGRFAAQIAVDALIIA